MDGVTNVEVSHAPADDRRQEDVLLTVDNKPFGMNLPHPPDHHSVVTPRACARG